MEVRCLGCLLETNLLVLMLNFKLPDFAVGVGINLDLTDTVNIRTWFMDFWTVQVSVIVHVMHVTFYCSFQIMCVAVDIRYTNCPVVVFYTCSWICFVDVFTTVNTLYYTLYNVLNSCLHFLFWCYRLEFVYCKNKSRIKDDFISPSPIFDGVLRGHNWVHFAHRL